MTPSGSTSFLEESEKKWSEAKRIQDQGKLALVPCIRCSRASEKCWVGADSKKCAYCTENMMLCTVNADKYRPVDNAKAVVAETQPPRYVSPEQGSEEAFKEEAERLYALNPSWHIQEAETELSSPQPSAAKLSHRKRFGKRIRKDHTVVDENLFFEPIKPKLRPRRKGVSKPVDILQETFSITPKRIKQEPKGADIEEELEAASGSEYQPDEFNSGSESPPRITAESESVESFDSGQEEEQEEEASPETSEDIAALRREMLEFRHEMKEMRKEFRNGFKEIFLARKHQPHKREIEIIDLEA